MQSTQLTKTWICDSCDELIQKPDDGWVEWISYKGHQDNFRLVHHARTGSNGRFCQFSPSMVNGVIQDGGLSMFLGVDGLMQLLSLLSEQQLPQNQIIEMIKRLHIPGYEHARNHL